MASVQFKSEKAALTAALEGEIDHHSVQALREQIDAQVLSATPMQLILEFRGVTFMDSSGIGLIMGRSTMMKVLGGKLYIRNPPPQVVRVLHLAQINTYDTTSEVYAK